MNSVHKFRWEASTCARARRKRESEASGAIGHLPGKRGTTNSRNLTDLRDHFTDRVNCFSMQRMSLYLPNVPSFINQLKNWHIFGPLLSKLTFFLLQCTDNFGNALTDERHRQITRETSQKGRQLSFSTLVQLDP